jgi:ribosomal protein S4
MPRVALHAGEPELAVAPAAVHAPVHVYKPGTRWRDPELLTKYGEDREEAPVLLVFYGQHYDALVDASVEGVQRGGRSRL